MKTKKFTASQYRRMEAVVASGEIGEKTRIEVALMLKQAAELATASKGKNLKLVEYNPRFFNKNGKGTGRSAHIFCSYEVAKYHGERIASKSEKVKVFSREVSEWKEVKDGE